MSDAAKVLLVEGPGDQEVLKHLLSSKGIRVPDDLDVAPRGGFETLRKRLGADLDVSGRTHVGVIVDADADSGNRWRSLRDRLARFVAEPLPEALPSNGLITTTRDGVHVGVWVMPDNGAPGAIEDFLLALMKPEDQWLLRHAEASVEAIPPEHRRFKSGHDKKAVVHTWLAWQKEPGCPLGLAVTKRYLRPDHDRATPLVTWVRSLFDLAVPA